LEKFSTVILLSILSMPLAWTSFLYPMICRWSFDGVPEVLYAPFIFS
jgi:hypothetical protein